MLHLSGRSPDTKVNHQTVTSPGGGGSVTATITVAAVAGQSHVVESIHASWDENATVPTSVVIKDDSVIVASFEAGMTGLGGMDTIVFKNGGFEITEGNALDVVITTDVPAALVVLYS